MCLLIKLQNGRLPGSETNPTVEVKDDPLYPPMAQASGLNDLLEQRTTSGPH